jgi:hypothetical protein
LVNRDLFSKQKIEMPYLQAIGGFFLLSCDSLGLSGDYYKKILCQYPANHDYCLCNGAGNGVNCRRTSFLSKKEHYNLSR